MSKVAVVTDSTGYIPSALLRNLPIQVLPLQVIWGNQVYLDGVDIQPDEFYTRLSTAKVMPSTSQATPAQFMEAYKKLLEEGYDILTITISSKLSGTMDSAIQAKNSFPGAHIELFDSLSSGMALGFQALAAARSAAEGATLKECLSVAEQARQNSGVIFVVDTLEFLRRGGRIGGAAAFLGQTLNIKPILELRDGRIEAIEKVRTRVKAVNRLLELVENRIGKHTPIRLSTLHANAEQDALDLLEKIRQRYNMADVSEAVCTSVSPVIGTHTGPGALAIAYLFGM
jgi:DegV family protein with EDD domain